MKHKFLFIFFLFISFLLRAQTDNIHHKVFLEKINNHRATKKIKPLESYAFYDKVAEDILNKNNNLKNWLGKYNEDSVRSILLANRIYDYQFKIIESTINTKNSEPPLSSELQNILNDSLYTTVGLASNGNKNLIILIKKIVIATGPGSGDICVVNPLNKSITTPSFWGIAFKTSLREVGYVGLERLEDLKSNKTFLIANSDDGILKIDSIKSNVHYLVLLHENKIIYIHKR